MKTLLPQTLELMPPPWRYDPHTRNVLACDGAIVCRNGDTVFGAPNIGATLASVPELLNTLEHTAAALARYGHHDSGCPLHAASNRPGDPRCTCGFSAACLKADAPQSE